MRGVILLDFFGTLVEYEPDRTALAYPRTHELVAALGWVGDHHAFVTTWDTASHALDTQYAARHQEPSMVDYAAAFARQAGIQLSESAARELATTFVGEWSEHVHPIEGAGDVLVTLGRSHRLGIVSNTNDPEMVPRLVAEHFTDVAFEHIVLSVDIGYRKPHPSVYAAALDRFDVAPTRAIFVGDSIDADYQGPIAAGMRALLIDPTSSHAIPEAHRLHSVLDLAAHL